MSKTIEVFSAGCATCRDAVQTVRRIAGAKHHIQVQDMHNSYIARRAKRLGVRSVPAVAIDGKLAPCCAGRGVNEDELRGLLA